MKTQGKHEHDIFELASFSKIPENVVDYNLITEMHGYQNYIIISRVNVGIVLRMHSRCCESTHYHLVQIG